MGPWWGSAICSGEPSPTLLVHTSNTYRILVIILHYAHTYVREYIQTYVHGYIYTYMYPYTHICIDTFIHKYIHLYIHTYIHTHTQTDIHNYIQTYTRKKQIQTYINTSMCTYISVRTHIHTLHMSKITIFALVDM